MKRFVLDVSRVREIRKSHGVSLYQAKRMAQKEELNRMLDEAETINELRQILDHIIRLL